MSVGRRSSSHDSVSAPKRLLLHISHYSLGSFLTMIAGLVTFPVLTRTFSVEDYGVMNLVAATLTITVALGKLGVQQSIIRYHSEISAHKSRYTLKQLYATTWFGMLASALVVAAAMVIFTQVAPEHWLEGGAERLRVLFGIAAIVLVIQVLESALINFLRAEQRTTVLVKYQVAKKYLGLTLILSAVLLLSRTLTAFYTATLVSEGLAVAALSMYLFSKAGGRPVPRSEQFSRPLYRELLGFGIPMMIGYEMAGIILSVGDRYVIDGLLGEAPLGLYGAAYNLCQYVQAVFIASVGQAIMPIYMQMYDRQGQAETSAFISRSLRTYVLFGMPVIGGLAAVSGELLPSLASEKYASAASVLPWVIAGMVVDGTGAILGAGLFIHRKTRAIMAIVLGSAILNIVLNLILVPRVGIIGAAVATLVSYAVAVLAMATAGRLLLPVTLPWLTMVRAGVASAAMYFAVKGLHTGRRLETVGVQLAVGALIYGVLIVLIDRDARALGMNILAKLRPGRAGS